jgi:hypothetical protein
MAADIAGSARDQDRHDRALDWRFGLFTGRSANEWLGRPASGYGYGDQP